MGGEIIKMPNPVTDILDLKISLSNGTHVNAPLPVWIVAMLQEFSPVQVVRICDRVAAMKQDPGVVSLVNALSGRSMLDPTRLTQGG